MRLQCFLFMGSFGHPRTEIGEGQSDELTIKVIERVLPYKSPGNLDAGHNGRNAPRP